jgi:hypothetical protein
MLSVAVYHGPMAKTRAMGALLALVVLLAGCGGGGPAKPLKGAAYVQRVDAIANGLDSLASSLSSQLEGGSSPTAGLIAARTALRKAATELAAITPPPAIKTQHERLVAAVNELAGELTPVIAKVRNGQFDSLGSALSLKGVNDARAAIAAITKAGYAIQIPLLS